MKSEENIKKEEPLVSVIVPVYNVEKYLGQCLESIVSQSYTKLEIIIVNDGATDGSLKIAEEFEAKDDRIKIYTKQNAGLAAARNSGIDVASGVFLMFVDSDDIIAPCLVENLVNPILGKTRAVSLVKFTKSFSKLSENKNGNCPQGKENSGSYLDKLQFLETAEYPTFAAYAKMYPRNLIENLKFPEIRLHEDLFWTLKLIDSIKEIVLVDYIGYYYRFNEESLSNSKITSDNNLLFEVNQTRINYIKENHAEALNYVYRICMQDLMIIMSVALRDGSEQALIFFNRAFTDAKSYAKLSKHNRLLFSSKFLFKKVMGFADFVYTNDVLRNLAKKII